MLPYGSAREVIMLDRSKSRKHLAKGSSYFE